MSILNDRASDGIIAPVGHKNQGLQGSISIYDTISKHGCKIRVKIAIVL
jgi:hypothetical protein